MKWLASLLAIALVATLLSSCSGAHWLSLPLDADGRGVNSPYAETEPDLASDRYLAFVSDRKGSPDIYLYDLHEKTLIDLPALNSVDSIAAHPRISRDGRFLVFEGNVQGTANIYLYDREMQVLKNLTASLDADVRHPSISGDGDRIVFESNARGRWDLMLYDRFGKPLPIPNTIPNNLNG